VRRRNGTQTLITILLVAGLICGGAASGVGLGILSGIAQVIPGVVRTGVLVAVAIAVLVRDFGLYPVPFPQNARQVPQTIFVQGREQAALRFGFELGTGMRTYAPSSAPHLLAVATLLFVPGLPHALLAGAAFGAGRALMPVARKLSHDAERWDQGMAVHERRLIATSAIIALSLVTLLVASSV
jgi:hypothetical protein